MDQSNVENISASIAYSVSKEANSISSRANDRAKRANKNSKRANSLSVLIILVLTVVGIFQLRENNKITSANTKLNGRIDSLIIFTKQVNNQTATLKK